MSILIVTGAIAPYTQLLYKALAAAIADSLHVCVCVDREPARSWALPPASGYVMDILSGIRLHRGATRNFYFNPSVVGRIRKLAPRLVVVNDFSPTALLAVLTARHLGIPVGVRTDGVLATDPGAHSMMRRFMRRAIVKRSRFGVGPSYASLRLLHLYGVSSDRLVLAPLSAGWSPTTASPPFDQRPYDLLFCGSLNDELKGALFFADVVTALARRKPNLTVRVAGDGPLRAELERRLAEARVAAHFDGFVQQSELEAVYDSARVFLFPSRADPWGVVVNEALQCGTPVIASPHATAASELLAPSKAGVVLPLHVPEWVDAAFNLLTDVEQWNDAHRHALGAGAETFLAASVAAYQGIIERHAR